MDSKRDHPTVVEVISAYARERTAPIQRVRPANRRTAHPRSPRKEVKLGADVEAVLTVLGRLPSRTGVRRGDLSGANLTGAHFFRADLTGAHLDEASFGGAKGLVQEQLDGAIGDGRTTLPAGLRRPESWSEKRGVQPG